MRRGLGGCDDDELAALAASGDGGAFGVLYGRYRERLRRYCLGIVRDEGAAEDVAQEAMLRAWRGLGGRSERTGFRAWLFAITRNAALDEIGRARVRVSWSVELERVIAPVADVAEEVDVRLRMDQLWGDLGALPLRQREAIVLHEMFGVSFRQVAEWSGGGEKAARQAAVDARRGLAVALVGRERPCADVRSVLAESDRRGRRRGWVASHLRGCVGCRAFAYAAR